MNLGERMKWPPSGFFTATVAPCRYSLANVNLLASNGPVFKPARTPSPPTCQTSLPSPSRTNSRLPPSGTQMHPPATPSLAMGSGSTNSTSTTSCAKVNMAGPAWSPSPAFLRVCTASASVIGPTPATPRCIGCILLWPHPCSRSILSNKPHLAVMGLSGRETMTRSELVI